MASPAVILLVIAGVLAGTGLCLAAQALWDLYCARDYIKAKRHDA